jgi:type IV pilus assembly protein PilB
MSTYGFTGDLLIRTGVLDTNQLALALEAQSKNSTTLGKAIADLGFAEESKVAAAIASALRLEYLEGEPNTVGEEATALLKPDFCKKRHVLPLALEGNRFKLAVTDPSDYSALQDVEFRTGRKVVPVVVTESWFEKVLAQLYPPAPEAERAQPYEMLGQSSRRPGTHQRR